MGEAGWFLETGVCILANFFKIFLTELEILSIQTKINTEVCLQVDANKEKENTILAKAPNIQEFGRMTRKWKDSLFYSMAISSKEHSRIIKDTKEFINTKMVMFMKVAGQMT